MNRSRFLRENTSFAIRILMLLICAAISVSAFSGATADAAENTELRGVWVSSVLNIDYPKAPTTDANTLRAELDEILDNCADMGFNAVFLQVRPCGDALYKSDIFPWSKYLTGKQGVAPSDNFDPLAYAVEGAHKRGMELHAWINPYRITHSSGDNAELSKNNPAITSPGLVLTDSNGKMYYNPGDSASINLIVDGAAEIVENYDVDGLHMDDYFYPDAAFDDETTYSFHKDKFPSKDDWRRNNVDTLVKALDERLHSINPDIQFGISPRGIWANKSDMAEGSDTAGNGSYTSIYADSRGWVKKGIVDYIMPQLYWNSGYEIADYDILCDWWSDVVSGTDVKLYIGEGAYRTVTSTLPAWTGESGTGELRAHIQSGRSNPDIDGYCCFAYNSFMLNPSIYSLMQELNKDVSTPPSEDKPQPSAPPAVSDGITNSSLAGSGNSESGEYENKFTDMDSYWWAMDSINELAAKGIIKGRSETRFDPDAYITRADNTVLLLRVLGKTAEFEDNFDDVYAGRYYYNEIGMAKALGIASGVGGNCFDPDSPIMRQDMATLAYRVLSREGLLTSIPNTAVLNTFTDADNIYFYAREAIAACVDAGLMSGYGNNTINPRGNASRVEVALFIHRISEMLK